MEGKLLVTLALALLASTGVYIQTLDQQDDDIYRQQYNQWKLDNNRKNAGLEDSFRFPIFKSNLQMIEEHNKRFDDNRESFSLALNQFADLAVEEFNFRYLTLQPKSKSNIVFTGENVVVNDSQDWRGKAVTPVKNQGSCGSCWAFSATGALEGLIYVRDGTLVSLSEQELVDCAGGSYGNEGCNGGLMDQAFQYVVENGLTTEAAYPYSGVDGKCKQGVEPRYRVTNFTDVAPKSQSALKAALSLQPVSVAIDASGVWFQFYHSGVFAGNCPTNLNHGVLAVGYGTEGKQDFWIVKNSWGTTWGDQGYIKMVSKGDGDGQCGIQDYPSFPV